MTGTRNVVAAESRPWKLTVREGSPPQAVAAAITGTMTQLDTGLSRWIGSGGYCTLLQRALSLTHDQFPWLAPFPCPRGDAALLAAVTERLGSAAVLTGVNALITNLVDVLGRIIGDDMATQLVERACGPNSRNVAETDTET